MYPHSMLQAFELAFFAGDLLRRKRPAKGLRGGGHTEKRDAHSCKPDAWTKHTTPRSGALDNFEHNVEVVTFCGAQADRTWVARRRVIADDTARKDGPSPTSGRGVNSPPPFQSRFFAPP